MVRPKISLNDSASVSIRFPTNMLDRIDKFIEWFKKEYPGLTIGRPDVIRLAVTKLTEKIPDKPITPTFLNSNLFSTSVDNVRIYSDSEIDSFVQEDKLSPEILKRFEKLTANKK